MANVYVTPTGFQPPTVEKLLDDMSTEQKAEIDPNLNTEADSPIGQLNGIFASHLREVWEALAIAFSGFDPDKAEGFLLVGLSALTGTEPAPATKSYFKGSRSLNVTLDASSSVPVGIVFSVDGDDSVRFVALQGEGEAAGVAVSSTTAGVYQLAAEAETAGPIHCNANTLTVIATPVVGLNAVNNPFDAIVGQVADNDPALRQRREEELRSSGSATVDALRSRMLDIELEDSSKPVLSCIVFFNDELTVDPITGNEGKSLEVMFFDGVAPACPDNVAAQTIWDNKPGGIKMIGSSSGTAIDSLGVNRTVPFTRPTIADLKFNIDIEINPATYVGNDAAKAAIIAEFTVRINGSKTVRCNDYLSVLMGLEGVIDVTTIQIARLADPYPPSGTNLTLGLRESADIDTTNITITATPGTP